MNFVTQTHEANSEAVLCQSEMLSKLYPESKFYIYDGGLSEESRKELSDFNNTTIIDWTDKADFSSNVGQLENIAAQIESKIKDNTYIDFAIQKLFDYEYTYSDVIKWDFYVRQKPLSILDLTYRVNGDIFWIDDDAIIINNIDEIFNSEFDIGATIRSKYAEKKQPYSPVNTGVLVFNTGSDNIRKFVQYWLEIIDNSELSRFREQNAVEQILYESNSNIFEYYYNTGKLDIKSNNIKTIVFPCKKYNHSVFTHGIHPSENKILHFKSDYLDRDINKKLVDDIKDGRIFEWYRGMSQESKRPAPIRA